MQKTVSLDPNEKKAQSIRRYLIVLLLGLQFVTVGLIVFFTQISTQKDIDDQASIILRNALKETKAHAQGFLEPAYRNILLIQQLLQNDILSLDNDMDWESYFLSLLENNEELSGAYIARVSGDFFYVAKSNQMAQSAYLTKQISADQPGKASFFWRSESRAIVAQQINQDDSFDFKKRPWYQRAKTEQALIWTEPYVFFTSKAPGITIALPYYSDNALAGVIGLDIEITQLSKFLSQLNVYGAVSAFMVSKSGTLIAAPALSESDSELTSQDLVLLGSESLSLEREAISRFINQRGLAETYQGNRIDHDGKTYIFEYESFRVPNGPEWIISAYSPENAFLEKITEGERRNIWVAIFILLLSIFIGWLLVRKTWKPVNSFMSQVVIDQLTGLYNRRFLETAGSHMYLKMLRDPKSTLSIIAVDVDHFKKVNKEFGNDVGNQVLMHFAEFLQESVGQDEVVARYSGDTFVIVLPDVSNATAVTKMNIIRERLAAWPLNIDDLLIHFTFSAGVATIDEKHRVADAAFSDYIKMANVALRDAKVTGRDTVVSANPETKLKIAIG